MLKKLLGQKFVGFIIALATVCLTAVFGVFNEWVGGAIVALYGALCGANAVISRGYAKVTKPDEPVVE